MYRKPYLKKKYKGIRRNQANKGSPGGYKMCSCFHCRVGRGRDWGRRQFYRAKRASKIKERMILRIYIIRGDEEVLDELENFIPVGYTD